MITQKDKILIVGGYGNVGKVVSKILATKFPSKVIIAGRNKKKAQQLIEECNIQALAKQIDLKTNNFNEINFDEVHSAICCIEFLLNDNFILHCIKHQVNYTELATSYESYQRFAIYIKDILASGICLIPGVGLMPGLSGIFVHQAILNIGKIDKVQSFVLLGLGENHGLDAIRWMVEYANKSFFVKTERGRKEIDSFTNPMKINLLNESRSRNFYSFNFGDQHIITESMEVNTAETRLAFDSRFITWIVAVIKKIGVFSKIAKINPATIKKWLDKFQFGSEIYAVQTHCSGTNNKELIYLANGFNEGYGTGIVASYAVLQLYGSNDKLGIRRLEELISFKDFIQFIEDHGIKIKIKEK